MTCLLDQNSLILSRRSVWNDLLVPCCQLWITSRKLETWRALNDEHQLTSSQVSTALRPFFFAVHPDRFWAYPSEKDVNENSLKQLNEHLEFYKSTTGDNHSNQRTGDNKMFKFYLRNSDHVSSDGTHNPLIKKDLKLIQITIRPSDDINSTVDTILSSCKLSTEYLRKLRKSSPAFGYKKRSSTSGVPNFSGYKGTQDAFWMRHASVNKYRENYKQWYETSPDDEDDDVRSRQSKPKDTLIKFLKSNVADAKLKSDQSKPIRLEILKLKQELKDSLNLETIIWDSSWSINHCRGCLSSLKILLQQHSYSMSPLSGRTLIFGSNTGITYDGHVILSTEDVRQNWLKMITKINSYDGLVLQVPSAEKYLSSVLNDIKVRHRKFKPTLLIQSYLQQLFKLTTSLEEHKSCYGYPFHESNSSLENYKIVVESDSGPLMLSPTGQFICPSSCPPIILLDFISNHLKEAQDLIRIYDETKSLEDQYIFQSLLQLNLEGIEKDDNVTPDLMIKCIKRLLESKETLYPLLKHNRIRISKYYAVQDSGEICIPWNFDN